ncbi:cytochrome P450 [Sandaracinobacter neustonicus]|uniref:Cytochrome P450 n=1 Tax=Sandaracinobacter neustonicus TaxID=1715348 RepID=A0A501XWE8_9SPHN|nr:cytochrome P450 [Sandaracinobacter neustonicus]TPE64789.1 cytochrome P450 [Sandaracinobacter neustonicus]
MATLARPVALPPEVLDIGNPHLWTEYSHVLPYFAEMRHAGPVHWCPESMYGPYWNIVSHQHIMEVEGRPEIFSSSWEKGGITIADTPEGREDEPKMPMFIAMDRPDHTGQRRTVAPAFTPAEMLRQQAGIRQRTAELLDSLPVGAEFDWVDKVSIELTTGMLAILFDFPWEDRRLLTKWSDAAADFEAIEDEEKNNKRWETLYEMVGYFTRLWNERASSEPRPDLISMMIHSDATKNMTPQEYLGNLVLLIVGGNDTTRNTMSGSVMVQNLYPDNWAKMMADPSLIPNGVSELIRWQTPLAHMRRTATEDFEVGGQLIRAGEKVLLWYLSANRDEAIFPNGDIFDPCRENSRRHLSFGFGIHRCVGARLAELQIGILLEEMQKRQMKVKIVGEPTRVYSSFVHGFRSLPVVMTRS